MTVQILQGDVFDMLATLPDESVHCVVTSPPYWGLRDYGVPGQIGLEPTMAEYVETMVQLFRDVRRVLRKDGTVWLNLGDSYAGGGLTGRGDEDMPTPGARGGSFNGGIRSPRPRANLKPKDLCMIPSRVALALQDDGWYLRSEIIWAKPNPMPESVTDRPATAHEKIFLLTKSARYFYDHEAVRREAVRPDWAYETATTPGNGDRNDGGCTQRKTDKQRGHGRRHAGFNDRWDAREEQTNGANLRNVWTMATKPFPDAHFATFPPEIPEACIKAGCPKGGMVLDPFGGAGTTGLVADRLGRDAILIELNPEYAEMARTRIVADGPLFAEVSA